MGLLVPLVKVPIKSLEPLKGALAVVVVAWKYALAHQ